MSIGLRLKKARENKGVSIQEVSAKTKIQEKILQALENDDISSLPNAVYTKAFLKKYAEFLGLDSAAIVEHFEKTGLAKVDQVIVLEGKELPSVDSERYLKKALAALVAFFVFVGLITFLLSVRKAAPRVRKPAAVSQTKKARTQKPPSQPVVEKPAPAVAPVQQPQPITLKLSVSAVKTCRLSVRADNRLLFEGFLSEGKSDQWEAKQKFELDISDGSAAQLRLNGRNLGFAGRGRKKNVLITKDGIRRR